MSVVQEKNIDDMTIFRNRIIKRMRDLKIGTIRVLAEKIVDTGIVTQTRPSGSIRTLKASSLEKTVQKHLSEPCEAYCLPDSLSAKHVQAYSKVLKCSVDFILGNTVAISDDICTKDLCNRTGLSEEAILRFLKMTDHQFAFRTLRIGVDEARDVLNRILLSQESAYLIKSLSEVFTCYNKKQKSPIELLAETIGEERIETAMEWDHLLDPLYSGLAPSEQELQDVFLLRNALDQSYEMEEIQNAHKQFSKYQLTKSFQQLIDQLFPEK